MLIYITKLFFILEKKRRERERETGILTFVLSIPQISSWLMFLHI